MPAGDAVDPGAGFASMYEAQPEIYARNAGCLREPMCKYICSWARFQSALIDKDSLIISQDTGRGEPRGSRSRKLPAAAQGQGDCLDCTLCVQVCPTGIDSRHGLAGRVHRLRRLHRPLQRRDGQDG